MPNAAPSQRGWFFVRNSAILAAVYNRALGGGGTALAANTAIPNVLTATVVGAATPLDTMLFSNLVANGDIAFYTTLAGGTASTEAFRIDASAGLMVFNEASADWDLRMESDNNANAFLLDAGTDSLALGRAVVAGAFLAVDGSTVNRAGVTSVGRHVHLPAVTITQSNAASTTLAIGAGTFFGIPTLAGANATQTITDATTVYIAGAAAAGTNMTLTRAYSLFVDAGAVRFDGNVQLTNINTFATTQPTQAIIIDGNGTAPAGAITTSVAIFASTTVVRKIIADGTASNIET